jgi:hypothetical protein
MRKASSSPLRAAGSVTRSKADSMHARRSKGCLSSSRRPASILEKSRMSLMMPSSDSPLERMMVANSRWRGERSVSSSRPLMPITAFIGVRISWLIVARNDPLAALASSAMRVCSSSCWNRRALATAMAAWSAKACRMP